MEKILISACLYGEAVRYDGHHNQLTHPVLKQWQAQNRLIVFCPEVSAGLPTPRAPAEIQPEGRITDSTGADVTAAFETGSAQALALCQHHQIQLALLKEGSPSCGSQLIYNGRFEGKKIPGQGQTTAVLRAHGIRVFSENQIDQLVAHIVATQ
ncbi:hypothetical protein VA7868_04423 [Vibrio aerogenes CECT 7868]|uniref:Uncharacterized protein n=1 Tax=Vibrio aerogenes CECT 7868 TaxID=1216006 RepID=A0A1M6ECD8_9VIBR|nr:DUF523 domain-containing protein [Vibrio aerogenes]SHI82978.1 hypothetical protein VA7868_04423 [Vibrio aerogenes CECT 7868]